MTTRACTCESVLWTERRSLPLCCWSITVSALRWDRAKRPCRRKRNQKGQKTLKGSVNMTTGAHFHCVYVLNLPRGDKWNRWHNCTSVSFNAPPLILSLMCGITRVDLCYNLRFKPAERLIWLRLPPVGDKENLIYTIKVEAVEVALHNYNVLWFLRGIEFEMVLKKGTYSIAELGWSVICMLFWKIFGFTYWTSEAFFRAT